MDVYNGRLKNNLLDRSVQDGAALTGCTLVMSQKRGSFVRIICYMYAVYCPGKLNGVSPSLTTNIYGKLFEQSEKPHSIVFISTCRNLVIGGLSINYDSRSSKRRLLLAAYVRS